jgi:hypothetical protein
MLTYSTLTYILLWSSGTKYLRTPDWLLVPLLSSEEEETETEEPVDGVDDTLCLPLESGSAAGVGRCIQCVIVVVVQW